MRNPEPKPHRMGTRPALLILALVALLALAAVVLAQGGYDLSWHAISGGGGHSSGGELALDAGVVQPAGAMQGGGYQLSSGFWPGAGGAEGALAEVYLPVVLKRMMRP
jgi:hypothetical protein